MWDLARGGTDSPGEWGLVLGVMALYLAIGYALEYRAKKRQGADRPAKAAAKALDGSPGPDEPGRYLSSRLTMIIGAGATGLTAFLAESAPTVVRVLVVGAVLLASVFAWAYFDHRTRDRSPTPDAPAL
ncbi:hypothetical protein [Streptomyces sp. NPDC051561]|uniref:hypothetical protein n=1 Tax=Streptomyces sp. NPDC051561 TaxID=3365658 RepID=UPI00378F3CE4